MVLVRQRTKPRRHHRIIFTSFFALGHVHGPIWPTSVNISRSSWAISCGISDDDALRVAVSRTCPSLSLLKWKDLMLVFFDESHARTVGINPRALQILFFALLAACTVAALQTVGAILVIAMVVTPGATAYLLTDRFQTLLVLSVILGALTAAVGPI
jgi:manganese/iron transport system permease protein